MVIFPGIPDETLIGKSNLTGKSKGKGDHWTLYKTEQPRNVQQNIQKVWREKRTQTGKHRTHNVSTSDWKGRHISVKDERPRWLTKSWVGTIKNYRSIEEIRGYILRQGLGDIRVRYLGDKDALLTASEGVNLKDIITKNKECMMELFEVLEPWCDKPPRGNKVVWSRCRGLPLNLWTLECFRYIARYVGPLSK